MNNPQLSILYTPLLYFQRSAAMTLFIWITFELFSISNAKVKLIVPKVSFNDIFINIVWVLNLCIFISLFCWIVKVRTFQLSNSSHMFALQIAHVVEKITGRNTNGTALNFYSKIAIITQSLCTMIVHNHSHTHTAFKLLSKTLTHLWVCTYEHKDPNTYPNAQYKNK